MQIHLIELSKSRATRDNIDKFDALERWSYFLAQADRYSAEELRVLLPEPTFDAAIGVLEMIARNPEQRLAYDARLKLQRDEAARIAYAREEGREEGRDEGELIGAVRVLEMILGLPLTDKDVLSRIDKAMLESRIEAMQRQIRERGPNRSDA